jgi:hypothetical protein
MESFSSFVASVARMREPTIGIMPPPAVRKGQLLQPLDLKIIRALHKDARKPVSEVAAEVAASTRTVQRRLDRMVRGQLVELSLEWYPDASDDIMSLAHVTLLPGREKWAVGESLRSKLSPNILFNVYFSNLPEQFISFLWTNSMRELQGLRESMMQGEGIHSIVVNVLSTGYIFDTWRDKLLFERR